MPSRDASASPEDARPASSSASSKGGKDGPAHVELGDMDSSPPRQELPIENDLMQLARLGELRSVQKLFDSGKYTAKSTDDQGITPLHWAAINGHLALCHFLLQSGADVNARGGEAQATPVLWASKRCHLSVVSLLLQHGADPLLRDDQGYNLLHSATLDGNVFQLILLLHQPDLPVDVPDTQGHTSLMWAAYKGFGACVDILLRWGADVHATDDMGFTALHWALVKGNYMCIQKLVEFGSDRYARSKPQPGPDGTLDPNAEGDTPSMTAQKMKSDRQYKRALLESGFDQHGQSMHHPVPYVEDRRKFTRRFFFLWPFFLGGLQLHMLAYLPVWVSVPGVLIVGYALQFAAQQLLRYAPTGMKHMHYTPFLAGIFAATLFWTGVQYALNILPTTGSTNIGWNLLFVVAYLATAYFYTVTMTADPGYVPKSSSRAKTKKTIDELVETAMFDERHFCSACMIRKPLRSKHCKRCLRCVAKEDHHCPWVDNCVAVNNHKHFVLYMITLCTGIATIIRLAFIYVALLPTPPAASECALLSTPYCTTLQKDPLTLITVAWASLQLIWVTMLIAVQLLQIARAMTTYESMRGIDTPPSALANALMTGGTTTDATTGGGPDPAAVPSPHGHNHTPGGSGRGKPKTGFCSQWVKLLGLDTFFAIAFRGSKAGQGQGQSCERRRRRNGPNPFSRGLLSNCRDFWGDGPVLRAKGGGGGAGGDSGSGRLGGERVDWRFVYEVPAGVGRGNGYRAVPGGEV